MPNIPLRNLGASGIVSDKRPYDLSITQWSAGRNVRFKGGSLGRYPTAKDLTQGAALVGSPIHAAPFRSPSRIGRSIIVTDSYSIYEQVQGSIVDVSPVDGTSLSASNFRASTTYLAGSDYLNRPSDIPLVRRPTDTNFVALPNWDSTHRAQALRSFRDYVVALNVTQGGSDFPGMVKWSDLTQYATAPGSWSSLDNGSLAGETVLNDITSDIVDGAKLGQSFIIYTSTEAYRMDFVGEPFVFAFNRLTIPGMMALDCAAEVQSRHYVFGQNDIFVTDSFTWTSIAEERVRSRIFSTLDQSKKDRCFVFHNQRDSEILFCYPTGNNEAVVSNPTGCNEAAVYNYVEGTWTFIDLANVVSAYSLPLISTDELSLIWEQLDVAWDEAEGTWDSLNTANPAQPVMMSAAYQTEPSRLLLLDDLEAPKSTLPIVASLEFPAYVEKDKIDLDEIGADLEGRKLLRSMFPQLFLGNETADIQIEIGRSEYPTQITEWVHSFRFNPSNSVKVDPNVSGKYLAIRLTFNAGFSELSGFDLDLIRVGSR